MKLWRKYLQCGDPHYGFARIRCKECSENAQASLSASQEVLPKLCRCAWDSLTIFLHEALDRRDVFPGGILVPQTFGGMTNWNPHVHALITDTCWDR